MLSLSPAGTVAHMIVFQSVKRIMKICTGTKEHALPIVSKRSAVNILLLITSLFYYAPPHRNCLTFKSRLRGSAVILYQIAFTISTIHKENFTWMEWYCFTETISFSICSRHLDLSHLGLLSTPNQLILVYTKRCYIYPEHWQKEIEELLIFVSDFF